MNNTLFPGWASLFLSGGPLCAEVWWGKQSSRDCPSSGPWYWLRLSLATDPCLSMRAMNFFFPLSRRLRGPSAFFVRLPLSGQLEQRDAFCLDRGPSYLVVEAFSDLTLSRLYAYRKIDGDKKWYKYYIRDLALNHLIWFDVCDLWLKLGNHLGLVMCDFVTLQTIRVSAGNLGGLGFDWFHVTGRTWTFLGTSRPRIWRFTSPSL